MLGLRLMQTRDDGPVSALWLGVLTVGVACSSAGRPTPVQPPPVSGTTIVECADHPSKDPPLGATNVQDFGAKGDGIHDDTDALQLAVDRAVRASAVVYIPRGTYLISRPLDLSLRTYISAKALAVLGQWATLKAGREMVSCVYVGTAGYISMQRLTLDGNGKAKYGLLGFKMSTRNALVEQVNATNTTVAGFRLEKCQGAVFRSCSAYANAGSGWQIVDSNAASFEQCAATNNGGDGFFVGSIDFGAGCTLSAPWSEANGGHGIHVNKTRSPVHVSGGWIEGNLGDGIVVNGDNVVVDGAYIVAPLRGKNSRAIRIGGQVRSSQVRNCFIANAHNDSFDTIEVEGEPSRITTVNNVNAYNSAAIRVTTSR